jgi:hypothetical protein
MARQSFLEETAERLQTMDIEWGKFHLERPRILYHYTTAKGLLGMLQTKRLWATNSRFMNDPTEIDYATKLVRDVACKEIDRKKSKRLERLKNDICRILTDYDKAAKVYVTCFCTRGDLLSQWRGYGAVGGGYSVGLVAAHLGLADFGPSDWTKPIPLMRRVVYKREVQERLVRDWVQLMCDSKNHRGQSFNNIWSDFNWFLSQCLNCFKDPAYEEEDEWRVIQYGRIDGVEVISPSFRENGGRIVPYCELDFTKTKGRYRGKLPIEEVRSGPTLEPRTTLRALEQLCRSYGYGSPPLGITQSAIPFTG